MLVGALGAGRIGAVDPLGNLALDDVGWDLAWWIGAEDRWHVPAREVAVRQQRVDAMPVVQTSMRVPGGDAVQRVYGVAGAGDPVVVEVENASGAPFVVAFVVRGARSVRAEGNAVVVDQRTALVTSRPPARWAVERGRSTDVTVCSGAALEGPFPATRDRAGRVEAALLYPVAHRTRLRAAVVSTAGAGRDPVFDPEVGLDALPSPDEAARGWRAQLDRGMRAVLPDAGLMDAVGPALAEASLLSGHRRASPAATAGLEDWGFDDEAAAAWRRLSGRERRRAGRRPPEPATWSAVRAAQERGGPEVLVALRSFLVHERDGLVTDRKGVTGSTVISVLAELPDEWRGQSIDVHDAPTRVGPVSFAVRWHGPRPALLWTVPAGVTLRAPGLDPEWSSSSPSGEALLAG